MGAVIRYVVMGSRDECETWLRANDDIPRNRVVLVREGRRHELRGLGGPIEVIWGVSTAEWPAERLLELERDIQIINLTTPKG